MVRSYKLRYDKENDRRSYMECCDDPLLVVVTPSTIEPEDEFGKALDEFREELGNRFPGLKNLEITAERD